MLYFFHLQLHRKLPVIGSKKFTNSRASTVLAVLFAVAITACQTGGQSAPETVLHSSEQPAASPPQVTLTEELMTELLTAEMAVRQGHYDQAVEQFLSSAQASRDPRLAAKAAYWSLHGGLYENAKMSARLWLDILNAQPQNDLSDPRIVLAVSLIELDQSDQALPVLINAIRDSDDPDIYKRIASEMSRVNNSGPVIGLYQQLVLQTDDLENANLGLAVLSARLNDFDLSRKSIDRVLMENPGNEDAGLIKISYLFETGNEQQVMDFAKSFLQNNRQAYRFRMEYARYLASNDRTGDAISQFKRIVRDDEDQAREARLNIISLAMQDENFKLADRHLSMLLEEDPTDSRLTFFRCQVQRELGLLSSARELCSEIVLGEFYFPAQLEIANVMADDDQLDEAIAHLDTVPVSGSEQQIQIMLRKQHLYYQAEEIERSVAVLDSGLMQYPESTSLLYARGLVLSEMGRIQEHERDMRKLIRLDPDNAHAYNALGYTLADMTTRYDEALELIQKAVELSPDDAYILDSLGWVYFKLNELEQAKVYLERAFELSGDAEIAAHLGELYWTIGEKSKAKSIWRKAQKVTPDNKVLNRTLERLL